MKTQVRILILMTIVALAAGWVGLRRGNAALEASLVTTGTSGKGARP